MNHDVNQIFQNCSSWVHDRVSTHGAQYTAHADPSLMASAFAVLALETLNPDGRDDAMKGLCDWICSKQDPTTGLFSPDVVKRDDCAWRTQLTPNYIKHQITYFCTSAIEAAQGSIPHNLAFARPYLNKDYTLGYLNAGPWDNPWNHSNVFMFVLHFLRMMDEHENCAEASDTFDHVLNLLLETQSSSTGVWHGSGEASTAEGVFAAYHFFPFFFWRGIRPPHAEKIIDSVLSMQQEDGLYGEFPGGGACEDIDAIDVLVCFSRLTSHRSEDVRASLEKSLHALCALQNPDGGFPDHQIAPGEQVRTWKRKLMEATGVDRILNRPLPAPWEYYSAWRMMGSRKGESTMWGAWFRPLAINVILDRYPDLAPDRKPCFRSKPCLGWHDSQKILNARPNQKVPEHV